MPLVAAEYQFTVSPEAGVAPIVTVPVLHREAPTATGADGIALMLATTGLLNKDKQPVDVVFAST